MALQAWKVNVAGRRWEDLSLEVWRKRQGRGSGACDVKDSHQDRTVAIGSICVSEGKSLESRRNQYNAANWAICVLVIVDGCQICGTGSSEAVGSRQMVRASKILGAVPRAAPTTEFLVRFNQPSVTRIFVFYWPTSLT